MMKRTFKTRRVWSLAPYETLEETIEDEFEYETLEQRIELTDKYRNEHREVFRETSKQVALIKNKLSNERKSNAY